MLLNARSKAFGSLSTSTSSAVSRKRLYCSGSSGLKAVLCVGFCIMGELYLTTSQSSTMKKNSRARFELSESV